MSQYFIGLKNYISWFYILVYTVTCTTKHQQRDLKRKDTNFWNHEKIRIALVQVFHLKKVVFHTANDAKVAEMP